MELLALPLWIVAAAAALRTTVALLQFFLDARSDEMRKQYSESFTGQMGQMLGMQGQLVEDAQQAGAMRRAWFEHETGKKFSELTDAEILSIVRRDDHPDDSTPSAG